MKNKYEPAHRKKVNTEARRGALEEREGRSSAPVWGGGRKGEGKVKEKVVGRLCWEREMTGYKRERQPSEDEAKGRTGNTRRQKKKT